MAAGPTNTRTLIRKSSFQAARKVRESDAQHFVPAVQRRRRQSAREDYRHLCCADRRQRRRLALGPDGVSQLSGPARNGDARLLIWSPPRFRRRSYRCDRQRDPQADAGRKAAGRCRILFLARPLNDRGAAFDRDRAYGHRASIEVQQLYARRRGARHAGVGALSFRHRDRQRTSPYLDLPHVPDGEERRQVRRGRPRPHAVEARIHGAHPAPILPPDRGELAHVSARSAVRPRLRHRDRSRFARDLGDPGRSGPVDLVDSGLSGAVHGRDVAHGHDRQRAHGRRLRLGVRQADPEALLQPDHHGRLGYRRRRGRRARSAQSDRRPARPYRGRGLLGRNRGNQR